MELVYALCSHIYSFVLSSLPVRAERSPIPRARPERRRVVIKLGTQVVMSDLGSLALDRMFWVVEGASRLISMGHEVLVVSSGAVGLGRRQLGLDDPLDLPGRQACAAVGQPLLMDAWRDLFAHYGRTTAQILVSADDFASRTTYLHLEKTLERLLELGVVPVINENDTISVAELELTAVERSFGDNDKLSALVASKLGANPLVILTNVDGIHTHDPTTHPDARRIPVLGGPLRAADVHMEGRSPLGRGGMASKLEAARLAAVSGVSTVIASGFEPDTLERIFFDTDAPHPGTRVEPEPDRMPARKQWIGLASGHRGVLTVNDGARSALEGGRASLLAVGITDVRGPFKAGDVVSIRDGHGAELGRGLVNFAAADVRRIMGRNSDDIPRLLTHHPDPKDVVIRRSNLVMYEEYQLR